MIPMENKEVAVIGLGPAGVTAAIYLKRYGMDPVCFEKEAVGGKVCRTEKIENYPGSGTISGIELGRVFEKQLLDLGIEPIYREVKELTRNPDRTFHVKWGKEERDFRYVILANGLKEKEFHIEGEETFHRRGFSYCAICDGNFYRGKEVAVIGAGNAAFEEAAYLATICKKVTLIARRKEFKANPLLVERFLDFKPAVVRAPYQVIRASGTTQLESLEIQNLETKEIETIPASGLFLYIGQKPQNSFIKIPQIFDENGYIVTNSYMMSEEAFNLYAIGDIVSGKYIRQVVTATSDGAIAAANINDDYIAILRGR